MGGGASGKYPTTWEFHFDTDHEDGFYYGFTKCPIAKFFRDNGMAEIGPLFCELDYITVKTRQARLMRDKTLAKGDELCNFWIVGDRVEDPK